MRVNDVFELSWVSLRRNPVRSGLTITGVMVGVFALTVIIALGQGLEVALVAQLTGDESQSRIVVRPGFGAVQVAEIDLGDVEDAERADRLRKARAKRRRGGPAQMRRTLLTPAVLESLRGRDNVAQVRPLALDRFGVTFGDHAQDGALSFGVLPEAWDERVIAGQAIDADLRGVWIHEYVLYTWGYQSDAQLEALVGEPVRLSRPLESSGLSAMLAAARSQGFDLPVDGEQAEQALAFLAGRFGAASGEEKERGGGGLLTVEVPLLGVIRERVEDDGFELWEDSFSMQADLFLPQAFAEELYQQVPSNVARGYNAAVIDLEAPAHVADLERTLRDEGYHTNSVASTLERIGTAMAILTAVVSGLTAIALLVATLGIVNTMVMNVSERTREIGVFKALGARDRHVRSLFVCESALMGLIGGTLGVAAALAISYPGDALAQREIRRMTAYGFDGTLFAFPAWLLATAMLFALGLSIAAALGPAFRASRVDPVEALRDE